ncbi:hypothetical protein Bhyg_00603, partial [Pseudolycoriella hygida]
LPRMSYMSGTNENLESMSLSESRSLLSNKNAWNSKLLTPSVTIDSVDFESNPPSIVPLSPSVSVYTDRSSFTQGADGAQDAASVGLLKGPPKFGEATRSYVQSQRRHAWRATFQGQNVRVGGNA